MYDRPSKANTPTWSKKWMIFVALLFIMALFQLLVVIFFNQHIPMDWSNTLGKDKTLFYREVGLGTKNQSQTKQANSHANTNNDGIDAHSDPSPGEKARYKPDYYKFDTSHPPVLYASSPGILPSLPTQYRIPQHVIASNSFQEHYANWTPPPPPTSADSKNGNFSMPLFSYNPSIVPLFHSNLSDSDIRSKLFNVDNNNNNNKNNNNNNNIPKYLATFRLSPVHSCGFPTIPFWNHIVNFLGFSLLDENLQFVSSNMDVILDLNKILPFLFHEVRRNFFEDARLFVLHDQLYLSIQHFLFPICVKMGSEERNNKSFADISPAGCRRDDSALIELTAFTLQGGRAKEDTNGLRVYVDGNPIELRCLTPRKVCKNLQLFHLDSDNNNNSNNNESTTVTRKMLVDYYPAKPRQIHDYHDLLQIQQRNDTTNSNTIPTFKRIKKVDSLVPVKDFSTENNPLPISNIAKSLDKSVDDLFMDNMRGSACCVTIEKKYFHDLIPPSSSSPISQKDTNNSSATQLFSSTPLSSLDSIQIGISHLKSRRVPSLNGERRFNYLSQIFAFSPKEPYELLVQSGMFCFGFAQDKDDGSNENNYFNGHGDVRTANTTNIEVFHNLTKNKKLELHGKSYNCPNIHFVSGISEKVGDSSRLIVGYGINDCVARFVEISKRDTMIHLLSADKEENEKEKAI